MPINTEKPPFARARAFLFRLWYLPTWTAYLVALLATAAALLLREVVTESFDVLIPLTFGTAAVALSSLVGGIRSGLFCAALSFTAMVLVIPTERYPVPFVNAGDQLRIGVIVGSWIVVAITCDLARRTALSLHKQTERVALEKQRYEAVVAGISDGFAMLDASGKITYANQALASMVDRQADQLVNTPLSDLFGPSEKPGVDHVLEQTALSGESSPIVVAGEGERWFAIRAFRTSEGLSAFVQDETARHILERRRESLLAAERAARSQAESANRTKDGLVAVVSHELRTPLTAILGWTELLQNGSRTPERVEQGLVEIESAAKRQAHLVDELLDTSRIALGKVTLRLEPTNLGIVVSEAASTAEPAAASKGISLTVSKPKEAIWVQGDTARLHQVLANLIDNALKFTPRGGKVQMTLSGSSDFVQLLVEDTGEGIEPEQIATLFDPFVQANLTVARRHGGLGLGLSIAKSFVEMHGGTLKGFSEGRGKGCTFAIVLPRCKAPEKSPRTSSNGQHPAKTKSAHRVMIVDDDDSSRLVLCSAFEDAGWKVLGCASAPAALDQIASFRPELIISDLSMPDLDGFEFMRRVRRRVANDKRKIPSIALSALAKAEDRREAFKAGFDEHVQKPVELARLLEVSNAILERELPCLEPTTKA